VSQSAGLLEIHGAEAVSDKEWQRYTRVHPKAVLLRAWGGEQPPMGVLNDALAQVQQHMDGWALMLSSIGSRTTQTSYMTNIARVVDSRDQALHP
jgi:hypothetical protein